MAKFDNGQDFILDPLNYIGRVKERDSKGRPKLLEICYDDEIIHLDENDKTKNEFFTFTTQVLLEDS